MRINKRAKQIDVETALEFVESMKDDITAASALIVDVSKILNADSASRLLQLFVKIEHEIYEIAFEAEQCANK